MSITLQEILKRYKFEDLPKEHQDNCVILLERINKIRTAYNKSMFVTSGYRSKEDHIRIYKEIAANKSIPFDETKVPMGSQHLKCAAVDIADSNGLLMKWTKENIKLLEEVGLFVEDDTIAARVHYQIYPFKSYIPGGTRFFKP